MSFYKFIPADRCEGAIGGDLPQSSGRFWSITPSKYVTALGHTNL